MAICLRLHRPQRALQQHTAIEGRNQNTDKRIHAAGRGPVGVILFRDGLGAVPVLGAGRARGSPYPAVAHRRSPALP